MDKHGEALEVMVAGKIANDSYGPWTVQAGNNTEAHYVVGTFDDALQALRAAKQTANDPGFAMSSVILIDAADTPRHVVWNYNDDDD